MVLERGTMVSMAASQSVKEAVLGQLFDLCAAPALEVLCKSSGIFEPYRVFMIWMISCLSVTLGISTKNMASNRPARMNSGGSSRMLLAVAMTRTGLLVSCIQVRKWPNMEEVVPPSVLSGGLYPGEDLVDLIEPDDCLAKGIYGCSGLPDLSFAFSDQGTFEG